MSKRFFVDDTITEEGKYRVLQEDSETKERFGVKDFDTKEEAQSVADDMQRAIDNAVSERITGELSDVPVGDISNLEHESRFKDTPQDLKDETTQE